jgi:diguanylate cyclase (GGDEF)-like protein
MDILGGGGHRGLLTAHPRRWDGAVRAMLLLLLGLLVSWATPVAAAAARLGGLPLMQSFAPSELPGAPSYSSAGVDSEGTLLVGSKDGVMVYRSGDWELIELPRRAAVFSLLVTARDEVYVAGVGLFGRLHRLADGRYRYEDMLSLLDPVLPGNAQRTFYGLTETSQGVHLRNSSSVFRLDARGQLRHWPIPAQMKQQFYGAGDSLYGIVEGQGLIRLVDGRAQPVADARVLVGTRLVGIWADAQGLLAASERGMYRVDEAGIHLLPSPAVDVFKRHPPYSSQRLRDGSVVFNAYDGTLIHLSASLDRVETYALGKDVAYDLSPDLEGGLWVVADAGLTRLRLPSPWTVYDHRHGLEQRLFDFAYFDGALWVGSTGMLKAEPTLDGGATGFQLQPWSDPRLEVLALLATDHGLLFSDRLGLSVLDAGAAAPRQLFGRDRVGAAEILYASPFHPHRVLVAGSRHAAWLEYRHGQWQVLSQWVPQVGEYSGLFQTRPDEVWVGDQLGGVHRWRFDAGSGRLLEQVLLGAAQGLHTDPELGTRLIMLDGALYAISGTRAQQLVDGRFVRARLPELLGLHRPWELSVAQTPVATLAWTSHQLWQRGQGEQAFRTVHTGSGRVPGYSAIQWQGDGRLRLLAREHILQFDPSQHAEPDWTLRSRIDRIQLRLEDGQMVLQPRQPEGALRVPPGAAVAVRFGMATMESEFEFRFRIPGYHAQWSEWSRDRDVLFQRLPPGMYTLEYQGRIRDGAEAEAGKLQLQVIPFWYERWWVRGLGLALGMLALAVLVRLRNLRVLRLNRELERKIAERTGELEQANRRLTELAVVDGLTGVANRRALERALERGWQRCAEHHEPLALMMADVDHFKRFNDSHGHQAGDEQLRQVAAIMAASAHGVDEIAARYGGEEFVLVLPGTGVAQALARAEALRAEVELHVAGHELACTISVGVAVAWPPAGTLAGLMGNADRALYRAKHEGRNCVRVAEAAVQQDPIQARASGSARTASP